MTLTTTKNGNGGDEVMSVLPREVGPAREGEEKIIWIMRSRIEPDPSQPRQYFDQAKLAELALSIAEIGQKKAIDVELHPLDPTRYIIVDGERRWRACGMAGVDRMKAILGPQQDEKVRFFNSMVANVAREGHTPMEYAEAIARIKKDFKMSDKRVAGVFGKSPNWVTMHLSLLRLPKEVTDLMHPSVPKNNRLPLTVAIQLLPLPPGEQKKMAVEFSTGKSSAKAARSVIARHRIQSGGATKSRIRPSHTRARVAAFAARMEEETELVNLLSVDDLLSAFEGHSKQTVDQAVISIDNAVNSLGSIRTKLIAMREKLAT